MKRLIQKLTETFSPSGYENAIREVTLGEIQPLADEIRVDALGNLIACKGEKADKGKRIMIAAQEEIGVRGAPVSAYGIDPEVGLAVDVTPTGDTPNSIRL